ncbi:3-deoxy-7-phosphoheptulonate synthase [Streptomyces wedmorensis]|uniref:Phospho-2-dehydro-3-deoxyheptonate aldolase n=1 Tax=Streptomyces wedmorensis TaxID=43759 RepID=A0ABW6ITP8_STRWE
MSDHQPPFRGTELGAAAHGLAELPPLVQVAECELLRRRMAAVARGEAVLLHIGQGAAPAPAPAPSEGSLGERLGMLLQLANVLTYATALPVIRIGWMIGQGAGVRSAREMYDGSARALNLIRAAIAGWSPDRRRTHDRIRAFAAGWERGARHRDRAEETARGLAFLRACGVDPDRLAGGEFFVGHEGLLPDYEVALTRFGGDQRPYATSGHLLWMGDRAGGVDGTLVEHFARIRNPIAVGLGPTTEPDQVLGLLDRLDPCREPGRLTFVLGAGAGRIRDVLPTLVEKVTAEGALVCWVSDPVRGNADRTSKGWSACRFDRVLDEVRAFVEVHQALGTHPGGVSLDTGGQRATGSATGRADLPGGLLSGDQSLDLVFTLAEAYRGRAGADGPLSSNDTATAIATAKLRPD